MARSPLVSTVAGLTRWLRVRMVQARTNAPPWLCVACRAANHAATTTCVHGCGERADLERVERALEPEARGHVAP